MGRVLNFFVTLDVLLENKTLDDKIVRTFFRESYLYWVNLLDLVQAKARTTMEKGDEWRKPSWLKRDLRCLQQFSLLEPNIS